MTGWVMLTLYSVGHPKTSLSSPFGCGESFILTTAHGNQAPRKKQTNVKCKSSVKLLHKKKKNTLQHTTQKYVPLKKYVERMAEKLPTPPSGGGSIIARRKSFWR